MNKDPIHHRAYVVTVVWTLVLLLLGSVVHATGSSLACPDWPTCYGTMMPEMEGGVFWEHLHRLVAGGLMLMFVLATWLIRREAPERSGLFKLSLAGVALLLVQAAFGGLTVLLRLPPAVSTTHLLLALLFLSIAVVLAAATARQGEDRGVVDEPTRRLLRSSAPLAALFVLAQSLLGGAVRHVGAGLACPDVPLCLGQWVPPLTNSLTTLHFAHRVLGVVTALVVLASAHVLWHRARSARVRGAALLAAMLVVTQVGLGLLSVTTTLGVVPVSAHTLVAAALLGDLVLLCCWGWMTDGASQRGRTSTFQEPAPARAR
jgi:heme A synthase